MNIEIREDGTIGNYGDGNSKVVGGQEFADDFLDGMDPLYKDCYRIIEGVLVFDEDKKTEKELKKQTDDIRNQREYCFSIINRGQLWYGALTDVQVSELNIWYQSWLDAPQTLTIPDTPDWIN